MRSRIPKRPPSTLWDHNGHYHDYLLRRLAAQVGRALDVDCGPGAFARRLAERAEAVDAADVSPAMIAAARSVTPEVPNVRWLLGDVLTLETSSTDVVCRGRSASTQGRRGMSREMRPKITANSSPLSTEVSSTLIAPGHADIAVESGRSRIDPGTNTGRSVSPMGDTRAKTRAGRGITNPMTNPMTAARRRDGRRLALMGLMPETVAGTTGVLFPA